MRAGLAILLVVLAAAVAPTAAFARAPSGWLGVMADDEVFAPSVDLDHEFALMRSSGVRRVRYSINWDNVQPYQSRAKVPAGLRPLYPDVGGVPSNFAASDRVIATALRHGLTVLPVLVTAPVWARRDKRVAFSLPRPGALGAYRRYLRTVVRRYGPGGTFFKANPGLPKRPIRTWQVGNEPDYRYTNDQPPTARAYVTTMKSAYPTIKKADRHSTVIAAGLVYDSWVYLARLYRAGIRGYFDQAAIHPYSTNGRNLIKILRLYRAVMRYYKDGRKPIAVTEISWPSARGKSFIQNSVLQTEQGSAVRLKEGIGALARNRKRLRLASVYWYTWMSGDRERGQPFDYAGLRELEPGGTVRAKPAFGAFVAAERRLSR